MTPHDLERERRVAYLMGVLDPMMRELDRIYAPGRFPIFTMIEHRKGKRLLYQADAILGEIARLRGEEHRPLPPAVRRNPVLPGRPMFWLILQWIVGVNNAWWMIDALDRGQHWLAAFNLLGVLVCTLWRLPPWRLIKQGKYNDDE
jgi:hypothetical protein